MSTAAVVLAAGKGTRFRSELAKVLHPVAGRTMLRWVLEAVRPLSLDRVVVVVGHQADAVRTEAEAAGIDGLVVVEQAEQRGTGHAVQHAVDAGVLADVDTVLVVPGDVPLLDADVLQGLLDAHGSARSATLLTTRLNEPAGYGRVLRGPAGRVQRIVEHRDATELELQVDEVNTSIYAFAREPLVTALKGLTSDNDQGEQYLTDVIALLPGEVGAVAAPADVVAGTNDRAELAAAGAVLRARILERHMRAGVTVVDPATTYVDAGVTVGLDSVLLPGTHLEGATAVGARARIGPNSRLIDSVVEDGATVTFAVLTQASIGPGASVGPYASLRPGTRLERGAKAGTFVEMKQTTVGQDSKVPHLSYMGDATIGQRVNVGAGTITCNYDGANKHPTTIGNDVFIGSDTMLVAPVRLGDRATTGAGSAITEDVPEDALAVERAEQHTVAGYYQRTRRPREGT